MGFLRDVIGKQVSALDSVNITIWEIWDIWEIFLYKKYKIQFLQYLGVFIYKYNQLKNYLPFLPKVFWPIKAGRKNKHHEDFF